MNLTPPIFTDEDKAREHFEAIRWPNGPFCPHCGATSEHVTGSGEGTPAGPVSVQCLSWCVHREDGNGDGVEPPSYRKWALGFYLMAASKKGMSAHQLHRMLGITYKTAWFMAHRIREAMRPTDDGQLGGEGKTVEADETYVGGKAKNRAYAKTLPRHEAVASLVERGGKVRSRHVADVTAKTLKPILVEAIAKETNLRTDQSPVYTEIGTGFASHATVNHSIKEYVRGDAHTNTVEGYFSIFKRGIYGVYHHVSEEHLKRYLASSIFATTSGSRSA